MFCASRACMVLVLAGLVLAAGCARSPEAKKARHLERGDKYFRREQYREAIIEYRNALRIEATNLRALQQLGFAHYQLGEFGQAFRYLLKSKELSPEYIEARLKLGTIYLLGRRPEEARAEAAWALEKDPKNLDALVLLAGAAAKPEEVDSAIRQLDGAGVDLDNRAKFHLALGSLYFRKKDLAGAEHAFEQAVARDPKSVEAHLALGDFYIVKRNAAQAEREFKAAAELAPVGSPARVKLADFYLLLNKLEEGQRILAEITQKAPEYLPAWRRLAEIAFAEGKYEESVKALQVILKKNPSDLDGHFLQGRVHLARRETTEAIQEFQTVLKLEPRLAPARYQLALAQLQAGNTQQAKTEIKEATTIAPNFLEATLVLAEVNIQTGALQPAIEDLERLIAKEPRMIQAHMLLGSAYLAKREPIKATEAYRKIVALAPKDPRGPYLVGLSLRAQGKPADAKRQFETALALAPGYVEPLGQLVAIGFAEKQPDATLDRVKKQIVLEPKSGAFQHLLGEVFLLRREAERAEVAFLNALELDPGLVGTYVQLANLYATAGKYDQALAKLDGALRLSPKNLIALTLSGAMYERKREVAKAQEAYEKALALNPRFAPAANNLAWLMSEHGGDKERALQLAQTAKESNPEDPHTSDTLGWILYKRGVYQGALRLFKESAAKLPENLEIQYHLGMAYLKVGDKESGRKALTLAITSPSGSWKDEARKALAELK